MQTIKLPPMAAAKIRSKKAEDPGGLQQNVYVAMPSPSL